MPAIANGSCGHWCSRFSGSINYTVIRW